MNTCSCCGQTLPDEDVPWNFFQGNRRKIIERIRKAGKNGCTRQMIFNHLYADDPDGGPNWAHNIIAVYISQINKELRKRDVKMKIENIIGPKSGAGNQAIYALREAS